MIYICDSLKILWFLEYSYNNNTLTICHFIVQWETVPFTKWLTNVVVPVDVKCPYLFKMPKLAKMTLNEPHLKENIFKITETTANLWVKY